jgi:hypothetical protein
MPEFRMIWISTAIGSWEGPLIRQVVVRVLTLAILLTFAASFCLQGRAGPHQYKPQQNLGSWLEKDWTEWTAEDVHQILYSSPWVSNCCRGISDEDEIVNLPLTASIVSSHAIRQALARRIQFDKKYQRLGVLARQEVDQRIANCLGQEFDNQIIVSFSFGVQENPYVSSISTYSSEIYLVTSDGRKIRGNVPDYSIARYCGGLTVDLDPKPDVGLATGSLWSWALYGPKHELAFPRVLDGKPTIRPDDKQIRIELDFYKDTFPGHSVGEIDFQIDKLIYQGKPDF